MWHEARKQEKKIRGILVDYKRRAERRRDFYEKIKADPTQFLQLHGRPVKIHLDPAVALAADSPANMMPWQGQSDILIDRFDVRAHLDIIPNFPNKPDVPRTEELSYEDRMANYERYRIIVQNDFLGIGEEKFLHQLYLEEQFGPTEIEKKPSKSGKGAAIPFTYDDDPPAVEPQESAPNPVAVVTAENPEEDEDDDDSDIDFDLCVDVSAVSPQQAHEMNVCANVYGMCGNDFYSFLTRDIEEKESLRLAREQEEEKAMFSGRKSRRERRAFRERRLQGRKISPPSYAARTSPTYDPYRKSESKSRSRSHSPINSGQITYITSFGGEDDEADADKTPSVALERPKSSSSRSSRKLTTSENSSKYKSHSYRTTSPESSRQWRGFKSPTRPSESFKKRHRSRSRSPDSYKYRRSNKSRSRSPDSPRYRRSNHSRSRTPSDSYKYKRGNKSRSPESPRYRRNRSRSYSPVDSSKYRRVNKSRSPERRRRSPSPKHRRGNRSRSRSSDSSRHKRSNRSRSHSSDNSKNRKRSRSRSPPKPKLGFISPKKTGSPPPPPVRRYYGTRKGQSSSSELEDLSDVETNSEASNKPQPSKPATTAELGNTGGGNKYPAKGTARERLKKKMQTLLNRQYKADKQAERMRVKKQLQERQEREDELREIAIKLRRRERARRHRDRGDSDDESDSWRSSSSLSSYSPSRETSPRQESYSKSRRDDERASVDRDSDSTSSCHRDRRLVDY